MTEKLAIELVQQYIDGWKENDVAKIIAGLTKDCVIVESHGPTYHGILDVEHWFEEWLRTKSKVVQWKVLSSYYLPQKHTGFFEWDFSYFSRHRSHAFSGISVVKFFEGKICSIHEYRMTNRAFEWNNQELI